MLNQISNIELVKTKNCAYISNNRRFKLQTDRVRKVRKVDPFAASFNKALLNWENVILTLFSKMTPKYQNRILKYSSQEDGVRYREIDFIAESNENEFVFCELKLKSRYKDSLSSSESGWAQLNKSITIASKRYDVQGGVAVCVDMSPIYGTDNEGADTHYSNLNHLLSEFKKPSKQKQVIWLDGRKIVEMAIDFNLLTHMDVIDMAQLFKENAAPLSVLEPVLIQRTLSPFEVLRQGFSQTSH